MAIQPESITTLPKTPVVFGCHQGREGSADWGIPSGANYEGTIVRRLALPDCATGPLNWKAALSGHVRHDLPPLSRPENFLR